jgi:hypothetical protein
VGVEERLQRPEMLVEVERANHRDDFLGKQSGRQSSSTARCLRDRVEEHGTLLG